MESLSLTDVSFELRKPNKECICVLHSSGEECDRAVMSAAQPPHSLLPWRHGRQSRGILERQKWSKKKKFMRQQKGMWMCHPRVLYVFLEYNENECINLALWHLLTGNNSKLFLEYSLEYRLLFSFPVWFWQGQHSDAMALQRSNARLFPL